MARKRTAEGTPYTTEQLHRIFDHTVSPEVFEAIKSLDPPLRQEAEERIATVFFSDIRNATRLVDSAGYEGARKTISELLEIVTREALARGGYVDKFVGDEAMVIFGAPVAMPEKEQALAAASLGLAVHRFARELDLDVGAGFNTGPIGLGNFATANMPSYTAHGDHVNYGAALEGLGKLSGNRPNVRREVRDLIADEYRTVFVKKREVPRGPLANLDIFAIVGRHDELSPEDVQRWDRYDAATELVAQGRPGEALTAFGELAEAFPTDTLFRTALERARRVYAEHTRDAFASTPDLSTLAEEIRNSVTTLFGDAQIALLEEGIEGIWRFRDETPFLPRDVVLAPNGEGMVWLRGLREAAWTQDGPEATRSINISAVTPLLKDNELVGALFVDCPPDTDLTSLTALGEALAEPWVSRYTDELRSRYREKVDDAQKLEELNRELESKSIALEKSLTENQELNQTLEQRVADHAERLERAATLKRYLPPGVVDEIIEGGRDLAPRTERRKITVMFSDVHGFTAATDGLEPEELARLLNGYLSAMSDIAFSAGATIDKFRGDGMMVFFGAPRAMDPAEGARTCLRMGIEMCRKVEELRKQWFNEGYDWDLGIRMGINTGYATVGEFGSADRLDYTAIGTEVNLAARLEAACETDTILISHATWALVRDEFPCTPLGPVELKGIHRQVRAYNVDWHA